MRFLSCLILSFLLVRCGVEAGNAGGTKGKTSTGNVQIMFAQQQSQSGNESLSVDIASLGLLGTDDTEAASIAASVSSVDLYGSSTATDNVVVGESQTIPAGSYAKIAIHLKGSQPVHYRDGSGDSHEVALEDSQGRSLYIAQAISVVEGKTTTIVVNLDPYQSLEHGDDDHYTFKPRGGAAPRDSEVAYSHSIDISDAQWVCAFAYGVNVQGPVGPGMVAPDDPQHLLSNDDESGDGGDRGGGLPGHETKVEGRPHFGTKDDLVKDTTSGCEHAFAKAPVIDGKFELRHLLPGDYSLRVFTTSGSFSDLDDISL